MQEQKGVGIHAVSVVGNGDSHVIRKGYRNGFAAAHSVIQAVFHNGLKKIFGEPIDLRLYTEGIFQAWTKSHFLDDYLSLQKMRFGPCLEYSLSVQPELLSYRLPKNLLQPIVENSLNHGMRRSKSIFVRLNAVSFPDHVAVSISDNGDGMDSDTLLFLQKSLCSGSDNGEHFGLYSVMRMIRLLYGGSFGLSIESVLGTGTCVTLRLPPAQPLQEPGSCY